VSELIAKVVDAMASSRRRISALAPWQANAEVAGSSTVRAVRQRLKRGPDRGLRIAGLIGDRSPQAGSGSGGGLSRSGSLSQARPPDLRGCGRSASASPKVI